MVKEKRIKLVAVSLSSQCIKKPKCSFCYNNGGGISAFDKWRVGEKIDDLSPQVVCLEYSGYNLGFLDLLRSRGHILTMTTMPQLVTTPFCKLIKANGVSALSISYDSEKVKSVEEWVAVAMIAKNCQLKVGCNFLIEEVPFQVPKEILATAHQLNLLVLKPYGKLDPYSLDYVKLEIERCKSFLPVAVDNCLGYQLDLIKQCKAGIDFVHINPDGSVQPCCFMDKCFLALIASRCPANEQEVV